MKTYIFLCVVLWYGIGMVWGQDECKVPKAEDMVGDSLPEEVNDAINMGSYPRTRIARLKRGVRKDIKDAISSLAFCSGREEKFKIPNLPEKLVASETCQITDRQIQIPERVILQGTNCWVLKPFAGKRCNYVKCDSDDCDVPRDNSRPVPTKFKCRSTNPRHVKVYAVCRVGSLDNLKSFTVRLPQCCSCIRFQCLWKG